MVEIEDETEAEIVVEPEMEEGLEVDSEEEKEVHEQVYRGFPREKLSELMIFVKTFVACPS